MNEINLRNYQAPVIKKSQPYLKQKKNILLQLPTGAGKTVIAAKIMEIFVNSGRPVWFMVHRKELIDQTSKTLDKYGIQHGIIAGNNPPQYNRKVQLISVQTLANRLQHLPPFEAREDNRICHVIIWDECHHLAASTYKKIFDHYHTATNIGLSATPNRHDGIGLHNFFSEIITLDSVIADIDPANKDIGAVRWLINNKYLSNYKLYSVPGCDLSQLKTIAGDYSKADASKEMSRNEIVGAIVEHWKKYANGLKTIAFAVNIQHGHTIAKAFNDAGIPAAFISSRSKKEDRINILRDFARGTYEVLVNVALFGEGFDIAANSGMDVTVKCVIDAAPTKSLSIYLQRVGRALRVSKCEELAVLLDHAGNSFSNGIEVHGTPDKPRIWTLDGAIISEKQESAIRCDSCFFVYKYNQSRECPACGHVNEVKKGKGRDVTENNQELQEMTPEAIKAARELKEKQFKIAQYKATTVADLMRIGIKNKTRAIQILANNKKRMAEIMAIKNLFAAAKACNIEINMPISKLEEMSLSELYDIKKRVTSSLTTGSNQMHA